MSKQLNFEEVYALAKEAGVNPGVIDSFKSLAEEALHGLAEACCDKLNMAISSGPALDIDGFFVGFTAVNAGDPEPVEFQKLGLDPTGDWD